jgi:hypothetical protein
MKFDSRQVRFTWAFPWPGRQRLRINHKGGTVQVLETALVVECYIRKLALPVVDYFFSQVLSEWTTITVPYSRIVKFRLVRYLLWRIPLTILFWSPVLLFIAAIFTDPKEIAGKILAIGVSGIFALLLTAYLNLRILTPRFHVVFLNSDGERWLASFRIRRRKDRYAFLQAVEANRTAAKLQKSAAKAAGAALKEGPASV